MLKVSNRKCIRQLSWKLMKASQTRNIIAIISIALTAILFTTLFTIGMSMNDGIQQNTFRQVGGYSHGTFKYLSEKEYNDLKEDSLIKEWGVRRVAGMPTEAPFHKSHVEIGYSDANCAHWSYCDPIIGSLPQEGTKEAATDLYVLELLGIEPKLGNQFTITFDVGGYETTQTFTLCGWWEYDEVNPAHHILISESRLEHILAEAKVDPENSKDGYTGSWNLDVMFDSSMHIESDMEKVLAAHGYEPKGQSGAENVIAYGVNWGYTGAKISGSIDPMMFLAIVVALLLIIFTGYLIIYNVFQISVANDVRFYGLLKTIGTTPKQLKRMIRYQAVILSLAGIPIGLFVGWLIGSKLTPIVIEEFNGIYNMVSINPVIFIGSAIFSLVTVLLSSNRPGKLAAKVSPIQAIHYTESDTGKKKIKHLKKRTSKKGNSIFIMARANLGRNPSKTAITILSMSLAIVLLTETVTFTSGFDMDRYISSRVVTDFIVADARYFQLGNHFSSEMAVSEEVIKDITLQDGIMEGGRIYGSISDVNEFVTEEYFRNARSWYPDQEALEELITRSERNEEGLLVTSAQIFGMESFALDQLNVFEGDLSKVYEPGSRYIAAVYHTDDYGNVEEDSHWAKVGDKVTLRYVSEWEYYYEDTGEVIPVLDDTVMNSDRPLGVRAKVYEDIVYEVAVLVNLPAALSYRYFGSDEFILNDKTFIQDTGTESILLYTFNTTDESNDEIEAFLQHYTEQIEVDYDYESRKIYEDEFESFRSMFLLLGSVLSFIVGLVGILNFFNAVLTSIMSRKREFAVMQSIGMTGRQLKQMLIYEGLFYAVGSLIVSFGFILVLSPVIAPAMESMFWFFKYQFTVTPVLVLAPVLILLGCMIPLIVYRIVAKATIVERLREVKV